MKGHSRGLHLLVWSDFNWSQPFWPMRDLRMPWSHAFSFVCEVPLTFQSIHFQPLVVDELNLKTNITCHVTKKWNFIKVCLQIWRCEYKYWNMRLLPSNTSWVWSGHPTWFQCIYQALTCIPIQHQSRHCCQSLVCQR